MIKRYLASFGLLIVLTLSFLSFQLVAPVSTSAFECADGSVFADPAPGVSDERRQEIIDETCASRGGSAPTPGGPSGSCASGGSFFGLPTWYKYLDRQTVPGSSTLTGVDSCNIIINGIGDVWLIVAAVLEIMLRVAALASIGFVIYGGVLYILSQGQPDKTSQALKTAINAVIGLVITIAASAMVSFIANSFN